MKTKIKGLSLLLAVIMALTTLLAACAETPEETTTAADTEATETTESSKPADTEASESPKTESTTVTVTDEVTEPETTEVEVEVTDETTARLEEDVTEAITDESVVAPETNETVGNIDTENNGNGGNENGGKEEQTEDKRFEADYAPVLYMNPRYIANAAEPFSWGDNGSNMLGGYISEDKSFVTLIPFEGEAESIFYLFQTRTKVAPIMMIKYRTKVSGFYMEFFMSSTGSSAKAGENFNVRGLRSDGEWDTKVIDLREKLGDKFDGENLGYIRFDFANGSPIPDMCELDIEYIAFFNSVEDAYSFEYGVGYEPPETEGGVDDKNANLFFNSIDIEEAANENATKNLADVTLSGDLSYVTLKAKQGGSLDSYINLLVSEKTAGRYLAIKYRTEHLGYWIEFFMDSVNKQATVGSNFTFYPIDDGEWHVFVIDMVEKLGAEKFNGEKVNYIRFDFMNCNDKLGNWTIDIEYIGFYDDYTEAKGQSYDPMAPVNVFTPEIIKDAVDTKNTRVESATVSEDGSYVTIDPIKTLTKEEGVDAYSYIFTSKRAAGRYMVVKLRTHGSGYYGLIWLNSKAYTAGSGRVALESFKENEWQYYFFDLEASLGDLYNGEYLAHLRFDFVHMGGDKPMASDDISVDISYVAFFDSIGAAATYAYGEEKADFTPEDILDAAEKNPVKNIASITLSEDKDYVTINATEGGSNDGYINLLTSPKLAEQYVAIRYRTSSTGYGWVEFFMDSVNGQATGGSNFNFTPETDGEWHVVVINVTEKLGESKFNGEVVNYIRFDFANANNNLGAWSIDVSHIGFYESEEAARAALEK